jgi:hypothetical protein
MRKTDKSIRNITLAAIKRSLIPDAACRFTRTYDKEMMSDIAFSENAIEDELPVACTLVDANNYTLITTRQVITKKDGSKYVVSFQDIKTYTLGNFKSIKDSLVTVGSVINIDGGEVPVYIESGKPSMIIVNAIGTILNLIEKVPS